MTALTVLLLISSGLGAQNQVEDAQSFASFWMPFKAAVTKGDKEAVATATRLPFFYHSKHLSKADFVKNYASLFNQKTQRCFAGAKPVKAKDRESYSVFCGSMIYVFEKVNGEYKLTDIGDND